MVPLSPNLFGLLKIKLWTIVRGFGLKMTSAKNLIRSRMARISASYIAPSSEVLGKCMYMVKVITAVDQ